MHMHYLQWADVLGPRWALFYLSSEVRVLQAANCLYTPWWAGNCDLRMLSNNH